ncbi:hypothetical protein P4646_23375 [Peribacillus simplex]|uniref:hypothetical protein n=1 Tax=Peribacillus simplex TaxID=1478 RepID=UPI002E1C5474|nr:hypothetical protein [Peribacillus simplex]MED4094242.1 hypothetical protein [Peribacillus simplex]
MKAEIKALITSKTNKVYKGIYLDNDMLTFWAMLSMATKANWSIKSFVPIWLKMI